MFFDMQVYVGRIKSLLQMLRHVEINDVASRTPTYAQYIGNRTATRYYLLYV